MPVHDLDRTRLRPFDAGDLPVLVDYWNRAFRDQRNFHPISADAFRTRILEAEATDSAGLILAWREVDRAEPQLVGLVHAFRPPPQKGLYRNWVPNHYIALLYVQPDFRRQEIGSRLLQAAENWLYYCPVHFASHAQPAYGMVEGPRPPFFGSTERMGISARNGTLIEFLAKRGYISVDAGDVSMVRSDPVAPPQPTLPSALQQMGLRPIMFSDENPFTGDEATELPAVRQWGHNGGDPYAGVGLVDTAHVLRGHLAWYPMKQSGKIALINFRVHPDYRGQGAGAFLLDWGLREMILRGDGTGGSVQSIELHTHLTRNAVAVNLYRSRCFDVVEAWVNLVKT